MHKTTLNENTSTSEIQEPIVVNKILTTRKLGCCQVSVRIIIIVLLCLGAFTSSLSRANMSTTIIAMAPQSSTIKNTSRHVINTARQFVLFRSVNESTMNTFNNDTSIHDDNYPTCGFYHWSIFDFKLSLNKSKPKLEFDWSEHDQDNLKGAFAIGYSLALIPSGRASEIYGGKVVALTGGIIHTSLNLVTPWAARRSIWLLLIIRIVIGAAAASLIPAFYYFIVHWIPVNEKRYETQFD